MSRKEGCTLSKKEREGKVVMWLTLAILAFMMLETRGLPKVGGHSGPFNDFWDSQNEQHSKILSHNIETNESIPSYL